ncbi:hypothetical protein [Amycolatopsis kentuckyensis]|uniref:hypothetical protein n=1 Tax=Amycolatopsis kentuckyensis TaxID=218823 RepID=UPI000A3BDACC|nr:hypothetical protein [Amycolatopsis kentuckyensis]
MNQDRKHAAADSIARIAGVLVLTLLVPPGPALSALLLLVVPAIDLSALALTALRTATSGRRSRRPR